MPDQVWTKTTLGNVYDDTGVNVVGGGDGAGNIYINASANIFFGQTATATLTVTEGVTIYMGANSRFYIRGNGALYQGKANFLGTPSEPILITSIAGSPAAGDYIGIQVLGSATDQTKRPEVVLEHTTVEYASIAINDGQTGTLYESKIKATNCTFRYFSSAGVLRHGQGGYPSGVYGTPDEASGPWEFLYCQFVQSPGDFSGTNQPVVSAQGPAGGSSTTRGTIWLIHCSFLVVMSDGYSCVLMDIRTYSAIYLRDCCFRGHNAGGGDLNGLYVTGAGIAVWNDPGYNFISVDNLDHPGSSVSWAANLGSAEQLANPGYQDEITPPYDLQPTGTAGDPHLAFAASDGTYVGALEPLLSTYPPTGLTPDPVGTGGVWAGRKQIVRRCSLGEDERRGRAIRIGLSSDDLKGAKLIGAIYLVASAEELK